jgi:ribosomal subunit interface protein
MDSLPITGKNIQLGDALQTHCRQSIDDFLEKYKLNVIDMHLWFEKTLHHQFACEFLCHLRASVYIVVTGEGDDTYKAFEQALHRLHTKVRRYKERLDDHHKHHDNHKAQKFFATRYTVKPEWEEKAIEDNPPIIAEKMSEIPSLSIRDAVMQLELGEHRFLFFRNKKTDIFNVVYQRDDGNIGWIVASDKET